MACEEENVKMHKKNDLKHRKVLNNLKPGWVAPDGGWGWVIVAASGLSTVFGVSINVCFGLIFRERLQQYGISPSQTTTMVNINASVASFVGLTNGPLFRKYTFRQALGVAGLVCSVAICSMAFVKTFYGMLFFYSILYASAKSVVLSAGALSLISYFTKKRRVAVGLSWAFSGLSNIVNPQIATLLTSTYGAFGAIILFGGMSLNTIICAILMQPVQMNAKRSTEYKNIKTVPQEHDEKSNGAVINIPRIILPTENVRNRVKYHDKDDKRSSQHFHKNDEETELETPLMTCTEDNQIRRQSCDDNSWKQKNMDMDEKPQVEIINTLENKDGIETRDNSYGIVHGDDKKMECLLEKDLTVSCQEILEQKQNRLSWCSHAIRTVVAFFDLDLLRDFACVNIMIAVSLVFITEINVLILTPYILAEYGLTDSQTAMIMSIGGCIDVLTRLIVSVVASRIGWENSTFLFFGVGLSALGHGALAHVTTYNMILSITVISSMGKAISFVFSALVLPDHVSLEKLPAATGLQLMTRGILYLAFGPAVGWIRETTGSYKLPLHFLNIFSYYIIISGLIGRWCSSKQHRADQMKEARV